MLQKGLKVLHGNTPVTREVDNLRARSNDSLFEGDPSLVWHADDILYAAVADAISGCVPSEWAEEARGRRLHTGIELLRQVLNEPYRKQIC